MKTLILLSILVTLCAADITVLRTFNSSQCLGAEWRHDVSNSGSCVSLECSNHVQVSCRTDYFGQTGFVGFWRYDSTCKTRTTGVFVESNYCFPENGGYMTYECDSNDFYAVMYSDSACSQIVNRVKQGNTADPCTSENAIVYYCTASSSFISPLLGLILLAFFSSF